MILECDFGNTRCKWRLVGSDSVLERGCFAYTDDLESVKFPENITRIRVATVSSNEMAAGCLKRLEGVGVDVEVAVSTESVAGVINGYINPAALGVDRWLALVAGYKHVDGAVLVIDAGTALTADLVNANGRHLGGYIAPGLSLMKSSLLSDTGGVRFDQGYSAMGIEWGCSTPDAVNAGVLASQIGGAQVAIAQAERRIGQDFAIILTGGDAQAMHPYLVSVNSKAVTIIPELVLDGLQWVLP